MTIASQCRTLCAAGSKSPGLLITIPFSSQIFPELSLTSALGARWHHWYFVWIIKENQAQNFLRKWKQLSQGSQQQVSGRARAEVPPDPELENWAGQYCLNFFEVTGESDACGRWCSATPKGDLCTH